MLSPITRESNLVDAYINNITMTKKHNNRHRHVKNLQRRLLLYILSRLNYSNYGFFFCLLFLPFPPTSSVSNLLIPFFRIPALLWPEELVEETDVVKPLFVSNFLKSSWYKRRSSSSPIFPKSSNSFNSSP